MSCSTNGRANAASWIRTRLTRSFATTPPAGHSAAIVCGVFSTSSSGIARSSTKTASRPCPMRILWLKSDLLLPLDTGGRLRTWHLMRHLAPRHEITYVAFARPDTPAAWVEGMHEVASRVLTVPRTDPPKGSAAFYADAALHMLDGLPYAVGKYRSRAYRTLVHDLVSAERFDVIVCDFLVPAVNLPRRLPGDGCPVVVFTHNVEAEIWRRHAETQANFAL